MNRLYLLHRHCLVALIADLLSSSKDRRSKREQRQHHAHSRILPSPYSTRLWASSVSGCIEPKGTVSPGSGRGLRWLHPHGPGHDGAALSGDWWLFCRNGSAVPGKGQRPQLFITVWEDWCCKTTWLFLTPLKIPAMVRSHLFMPYCLIYSPVASWGYSFFFFFFKLLQIDGWKALCNYWRAAFMV